MKRPLTLMQLVNLTTPFQCCANDSWDAVRYWAGMSARFAQATLACQVMAGFSLRALRDDYGSHQGKRNDTSPNDSERLGFQEMVRRETGLSDDTARRWINMADGIKARWKKLPARDRLRALMSMPPNQWSEPDVKLIGDAVHKATDGRTQLEFMWELGLAKRPQGSGAAGRAPGEGGSKKLSLSEQAEAQRLLAETNWQVLLKHHRVYAAKFTLLTDEVIEAQCAELEHLLAARRAWLKQPRNNRDAAAIERMFK
ncbi:MAG: hypothetical protein KGL39_17700 [Patescibacteria group bacterium]|nr:hypothetical protein [Patescibacteria group bacterium]